MEEKLGEYNEVLASRDKNLQVTVENSTFKEVYAQWKKEHEEELEEGVTFEEASTLRWYHSIPIVNLI